MRIKKNPEINNPPSQATPIFDDEVALLASQIRAEPAASALQKRLKANRLISLLICHNAGTRTGDLQHIVLTPPPFYSKQDGRKTLNFYADGSKTSQRGVIFSVPENPNEGLCAISHWETYKHYLPKGRPFSTMDKDQLETNTETSNLVHSWRSYAKKAGIQDVKRIRGHSWRRAYTQKALKANEPHEKIRQQQGWKPNSRMLQHYGKSDVKGVDQM